MNLDGKNVLITGAAVRLGRAIALELAGAGANILIHYRKSSREAKSLQKEIEALRCCAFLCPFDFASASLSKIRTFVKSLPAPVDVLVNNAAIYYPTPLATMTEADWDDFLATNLKSPVLLARELGLQMAKRKQGVIINMTDIAGENPFRNYLPYSISKAGITAATRSFAKEFAPFVRVNAVAPGPILEPPQGFSSSAQKKKIAEATLLKRFGNSDNIASAVRFLIENNFVTGQVLAVDGGKSIAH